jgi:DnaA family protein
MSQLALDLLQPLQPSLDNFVPGRNHEALATLRAVARGGGPQFVYLWGDAGSGRTHLLRALGPVGGDVPAFDAGRALYALDDVHALDADAQARLFVLLDEVRARPGARFVGAGDVPPALLRLRDDVRTRLAWGLVYQLHALSDAEKAAALAEHAGTRGVAVSPDLIPWMLAHLPRDMRALVAALDALDTFALARRRTLTVALAREWLAQADSRAGS